MIRVSCTGHIATSVRAKELDLEGSDMDATEIVDRLRKMTGVDEPGFNRYNTLLMVEDGEAFVAASNGRRVREGEHVVLIPFSHGG